MGEVQLTESPVFSVVDFLKKERYNLGGTFGGKDPFYFDASTRELGILKPLPGKNMLFFKKRDVFLGVLFMNASGLPGLLWRHGIKSEHSLWVLEIYGRDNLHEGEELANKLSEKFNKKVVVALSTEESKRETRLSDCG